MIDIGDLGLRMQGAMRRTAARYMPPLRQLEVIDATLHSEGGWVFCELEGSRVRCIVPANLDLSGAVDGTVAYVLWAIPLTGEEDAPDYFALGLAWDGISGTREGGLTVASTRLLGGPAAQTPSEGTTVYSNDEGQILAKSANGLERAVDDDTAAWMGFLGG